MGIPHMNTIQSSMILAIAAMTASTAHANMIYMTHQATGSGSIGQLSFSDAEFSIYTSADFDNTIPILNGMRLLNETAIIDIQGVGTFDITTQTQSYVNYNFGTVGLATTIIDLFIGPFSAEFFDWEMDTELGPISGEGNLLQWDFDNVETTGGLLSFDTSPTDATFTASYTAPNIPAPAALSLMSIAGIAASRRRR